MFNEDVNVNEEVFEDETLVCKDCGNEFVFTAGEKKFYKENQLLPLLLVKILRLQNLFKRLVMCRTNLDYTQILT